MSDDGSLDEELAEAIKRSLQDQIGSEAEVTSSFPGSADIRKKVEVIVIDDDSNSDVEGMGSSGTTDVETAKHGNTVIDPKSSVEQASKLSPQKGTNSKSSMLQLDRAQMERERLARLKRKTPDEPTTSSLHAQKQAKTWTTQIPTARESVTTAPRISQPSRIATLSSINSARRAENSSRTIQYPNGVVKRTFIHGRSKGTDDITIEEVLQADDLQKAVLSAFTWDFLWILKKLKVGQCDLVLVIHAKNDEADHYRANLRTVPRTRLCFPDMSGNINCMHSKLQLLFYPTYLRVVVPTANLTSYDWGETVDGNEMQGIMENTVFLIDFPRLTQATQLGESDKKSIHTTFSQELLHFCKASGFPEDILKEIDTFYDYTKSKDIAFVYSIGGPHYGADAMRNGVCGLANAVRKLGINTKKQIEVEYITSSIGSLNREFLLRMFRAIHGNDGRKFIKGLPKSNNRQVDFADESTESESEEDENDEQFWKNMQTSFRAYFPSRNTIASSQGGIQNGGTICFQQKWYNGEAFPKWLLHECESVRPNMLMHNKIILVRSQRTRNGSSAWAYIGSANLSESAWGKLLWDKPKKDFKITNRNWECGVIVTVPANTGQLSKTGKTMPTLDVFKDKIPVPMSVPARPLDQSNPPWFFGELRGSPFMSWPSLCSSLEIIKALRSAVERSKRSFSQFKKGQMTYM